MKPETDAKILDLNNQIGKRHMTIYKRLTMRAEKLWQKYGEKDCKGNLIIKDPKMVKKAVNLQNKIDNENYLALRSFLKGRVVWQGWV